MSMECVEGKYRIELVKTSAEGSANPVPSRQLGACSVDVSCLHRALCRAVDHAVRVARAGAERLA